MKRKKNTLKQFTFLLLLISTFGMFSPLQGANKKVLFIGNSYTYTNDLPSMINQLAISAGDEITYNSSTPGGYYFLQHFSNATTLALIKQGGWDFVVLQEQSQFPSFEDSFVEEYVYPYARKLDSLVKKYNPCAKTVFYMTWGRKYGDGDNCADLPAVCTYQGMDDQLALRYTNMADSNDAVLCPVGKVWRSLINNHPAMELYVGDGSHPSAYGTYAAACAFYAVFFKKDPALCTYNPSLSSGDASIIRNTAKAIVYDDLPQWYSYYPNVKADYTSSVLSNEILFLNTSQNSDSYTWDFGDGTSSTLKNPSHVYAANGSYQVKLTSQKCADSDEIIQTINNGTTAVESTLSEKKIMVYPNPANDVLYIESAGLRSEIVITNATGQTLKYFTSSDAPLTSLDIRDLDSGIYFVNIRNESQSTCSKFHKK